MEDTTQTQGKHRHRASFGKRQEYIAIAELLRRAYDVYMTLVDDQQMRTDKYLLDFSFHKIGRVSLTK